MQMIVVDVETSGTESEKHGILSIGAVDFGNKENTFYGECRLFEGAHIMKGALEVNGFSEEEIVGEKSAEKISESELIKSFIVWAMKIPERTLANHNIWFDLVFLKASARRAHIEWPFGDRTIDLHSICFFHMLKNGVSVPMKNGRSGLSSSEVSKYVGIPEEAKPHNALSGAKQACESFSRFINEKPMFPEFKDFPIPRLSK